MAKKKRILDGPNNIYTANDKQHSKRNIIHGSNKQHMHMLKGGKKKMKLNKFIVKIALTCFALSFLWGLIVHSICFSVKITANINEEILPILLMIFFGLISIMLMIISKKKTKREVKEDEIKRIHNRILR